MPNTYEDVYLPLQRQFLKDIENINCEGMPYPCLPNFLQQYWDADTRIVFVGIETYRKEKEGLENYKNIAKNGGEIKALYSWDFEFEYEFLSWAKGSNFNVFICKALSEIYGIKDWKDIKNGKSELSKSFAWANCNSMERYEVSAKKFGASKEDYIKVKESSMIFDNIWNIVKGLEPDLIIVLNWDTYPKGYFNKGMIEPKWEMIDTRFRYAILEDTKCSVIHVPHPRAMISEKGKGWGFYTKKIHEVMIEKGLV
jgi:hypothetical protein